METKEQEILTAEERADVLNAITHTLNDKGFDLEIAGYEDINGVFFEVWLSRKELR